MELNNNCPLEQKSAPIIKAFEDLDKQINESLEKCSEIAQEIKNQIQNDNDNLFKAALGRYIENKATIIAYSEGIISRYEEAKQLRQDSDEFIKEMTKILQRIAQRP